VHLSDRIQYLIEEGVNICQIYQHVTNENRKGIIADEGYNIILLQKDQTEKMLADLKKKKLSMYVLGKPIAQIRARYQKEGRYGLSPVAGACSLSL
jgi:hypothetical protein